MAENRTKHKLILPTNMNSALCVQFPFSTRDEFPFLIYRYKGRGFGLSEKNNLFLDLHEKNKIKFVCEKYGKNKLSKENPTDICKNMQKEKN